MKQQVAARAQRRPGATGAGASGAVTGALVSGGGDANDEHYYQVVGVEQLEPFLMSVVSDSNLWMWISSSGALTAGRQDADHALFPYLTDDNLHRLAGAVGPITIIARTLNGARQCWQPYAPVPTADTSRTLQKHVLGNRITLAETHHGWGLTFRTTWFPARAYGWVRESELVNQNAKPLTVELLDGLVDIMPAGISAAVEQSFSNLANAYKRSETGVWPGVAVYSLEAQITDRALPAEALAATMVWSAEHDFPHLALDQRAVEQMRAGAPPLARPLLTGQPGAYLLRGDCHLPAATTRRWLIIADTNLSHAALHDRACLTQQPDAARRVVADAERGTQELTRLLTAADGIQQSGDATADAHHLSNVLFNCMRGGIFPYGYRIPVADVLSSLQRRNCACYHRHRAALQALGDWITHDQLLACAQAENDTNLTRLLYEYLPLTFSRRHGDPSRPWNAFSIEIQNRDGSELLSYQGNWRDIFQNWEALLYSFPAFIPSVVAKFVNATTVDGYNPYRIIRDGFEWEPFDPENPWSNIGYWGDHQIVYLLRLLELWQRFDSDAITDWLCRPLFSFADVPYRLRNHADMVRDPRHSVVFDRERDARVSERVARIGTDGRLVVDATGAVVHVGLLEKLLIPALAKMTAFVPQGGIWMNTQRPEWNDANNALAGFGLSMVTLFYLRRYLTFLQTLIMRLTTNKTAAPATATIVPLSVAVAKWLDSQVDILAEYVAPLADPATADDAARRRFVDAMGESGEQYRAAVRADFDPATTATTCACLQQWITLSLRYLDGAIHSARRNDQLFHSYNLIHFGENADGAPTAAVQHLGPMLEGQVAALSSGALDDAACTALLAALWDSELYRADQDSFILYPARIPAPFHLRNRISAQRLRGSAALAAAPEAVAAVLERDGDGGYHFRPHLTNAAALTAALEPLSVPPEQRTALCDLYEETFNHHAYSGRSGSMHGYEGIGSIYWHMVGKLQVAVAELYQQAPDGQVAAQYAHAYRRIRAGLGFCKSPAAFGAIPTDCYSHTPAHAGAQQPGMTGQVKEGILARWDEVGIRIEDGTIAVTLGLLPIDELFPPAGSGNGGGTSDTDTVGGAASASETDGTRVLRVSCCATPFEIVYVPTESAPRIEITWQDGHLSERSGGALTAAESRAIFGRSGMITRVRWYCTAA